MGLGKRIVLFLLTCWLGIVVSTATRSAGPALLPDLTEALWIAESSRGLKVALSNGRVLFEILDTGRIEALVINEEAAVLWAYSEGRLRAYDFAGRSLLTRPIAFKRTGPVRAAKRARLALDPLDGSVWLGVNQQLYHVDPTGERLQEIRLREPIRALSFDRTRSRLWVGMSRSLSAYDASGTPGQAIEIGRAGALRDLAYDETLDALWVALEDRRVRRYTPDGGAIEIDARLSEAPRRLAPDLQGGIWIAAGQHLLGVAGDGREVLKLKPFAQAGGQGVRIRALAVDARAGAVWVASRGAVRRVEAGGDLNPPLALGAGKLDIRALALYTDGVPPTVAITSPREGAGVPTDRPPLAVRYEDRGIGIDERTLQWTANGNPLAVSCEARAEGASCTPTGGLAEGLNTLRASIADRNGNRGESTAVSFSVDTVAPRAPEPDRVSIEPLEAGSVGVSGAPGSVEPFAEVTVTNTRTGESVTVRAEGDGSFRAQIAAEVGDVLHIDVADGAGNHSEPLPYTVAAPGGDLPPDPATVAPPLVETEITPLHEATAFLYSGANPIQTGVAEGTIVPRRAAVVRGQILSRDNRPLSGATVTIKDHPEFGQTRSRADGRFDLAVNGGGLLTINYEQPGHLPVQRQVQTPWQDFVQADHVVMVALDPRVIAIDLSASTPMQVAQGSLTTDADGQRQATVLFPQGTAATMTLPDGTTQGLSTLHVRATEYTVGANGPKAMPGPLPPTSGYTYAVELSVDEAIAAGAKRVDFNQPLPVYIDNFLDFPVGGVVPVGWYDREKAAWIPSENGRVIQIVALTNGYADLDTDGDGIADDATKLQALGITDAEREQLATLFSAGRSFWRTPVHHFTPWDCNWPYGPPADAEPPPLEDPETGEEDQPDPEDSDDCRGCSIEVQSQTLGEEIPITGSALKLHYRSDRAPSRKASQAIDIPLSGPTLPPSLKRIDVKVAIAGRTWLQSFTPVQGLRHTFAWDGLDAYGRAVSGRRKATVSIDYVYGPVYYAPGDFARAFAATTRSGVQIGRSRTASEVTVGTRWEKSLQRTKPDAAALGGWALTVHHAYDPLGRIFYAGNGDHRSARSLPAVITTFAGTGTDGFGGDGGPALGARFQSPHGIAVAPDGALYIADSRNHRIRRISPTGVTETIAGLGTAGFRGDGNSAIGALLDDPRGVALGPDGSLYIADTGNARIRRIATDGVIETVAGSGVRGFAGDEGPARLADLNLPTGVAVAPDGTVYIADSGNRALRSISPDGRIHTLVRSGDIYVDAVCLNSQGDIFIADPLFRRTYKRSVHGALSTVAGTGGYGDILHAGTI